MVKVLLQTVVAVLSQLMTKENLKLIADSMLDAAENIVVQSTNTIDDQLVLPAIQKIRDAFDIPDNDEPEVTP